MKKEQLEQIIEETINRFIPDNNKSYISLKGAKAALKNELCKRLAELMRIEQTQASS